LMYQTVAAASGSTFSVSFPTASAQESLGFPGATTTTTYSSASGKVYNNSDVAFNSGAATNYLYSPSAVQLGGPNYLVLRSQFLGGENTVSFAQNNRAGEIEVFPVNTNFQGMISYAGTGNVRRLTGSASSVSAVDFYLTMGNRTSKLQLNGSPFLLGIRFFIAASSSAQLVKNPDTGDTYRQAESSLAKDQDMQQNNINKNDVKLKAPGGTGRGRLPRKVLQGNKRKAM